MGLLVTAVGFGQTYSAPTGVATSAGTNAVHSVHLGHNAGVASSAGYNVFIGKNAGINATGNYNSMVGYYAGRHSLGNFNVFMGAYAGETNYTGGGNIFLGHYAGASSKSSTSLFIGFRSGQNATGDGNVCLGDYAGTLAGSRNVLIGFHAGRFESGSNKLYIANSETANPLIYGDFASQQLKFNAKKIGIGYETIADGGNGFRDFPTATSPDLTSYRLFVKGGILASEVRVRTDLWPDYVFERDYVLQPLSEVEQYIAENKHLPNMPSAEKIESEGLELGNIVKLQQEKIEELTLHLIEQNKQIEELKAQMQLLINKE